MSASIVPPISTLYQVHVLCLFCHLFICVLQKLLDIQREANQLRPQYIEMSDAL